MHELVIGYPPLWLLRASVAAVWLYEGLWCKLLGQTPSQVDVVTAVPRFGVRFGATFLKLLGVYEVGLGLWVLWGYDAALCAVVETVSLVVLNINGLMWARKLIHEPIGMVVKNVAFLLLAWVCGAMPGMRL